MNISKEQFVQIIEAVIEQVDRDYEISKSLDEVLKDGCNHGVVFTSNVVHKVIDALDYDGIISWWFWDGPEHGKNAETYAVYLGDADDPRTEKLFIHDAGELYDYMMGSLVVWEDK